MLLTTSLESNRDLIVYLSGRIARPLATRPDLSCKPRDSGGDAQEPSSIDRQPADAHSTAFLNADLAVGIDAASNFYYAQLLELITITRASIMATTINRTITRPRIQSFPERWFFSGLAASMIVLCLLSFLPSIVHGNTRRAPLSTLAMVHGVVFSAWLLLFLAQSLLIATRRVAVHRRLGIAGALLVAFMIPLGYATTVEMIRRGFDLSGDLRIEHDARPESIFAFNDLLVFGVLAIAALAYRRQADIHKRLMLFANIVLMPAPLAHLIGHTPWLAAMPPAIVMVPISLFVIAAVTRDFLIARRVHPLTWALAILQLVSGPLDAGPLGASVAWRNVASWLARQ